MSFSHSVEFNKALALLSCALCCFYDILEITLTVSTGWADAHALEISVIAASLLLFGEHILIWHECDEKNQEPDKEY